MTERVWWLPSVREFWMEPDDPIAAHMVIREHVDAIRVENPEDLPDAVLRYLRERRDAMACE